MDADKIQGQKVFVRRTVLRFINAANESAMGIEDQKELIMRLFATELLSCVHSSTITSRVEDGHTYLSIQYRLKEEADSLSYKVDVPEGLKV